MTTVKICQIQTSKTDKSMSGNRSLKKRCGEIQLESPVRYGHIPSAGCSLSKLIQLPTPPLSKHQLKRLEEHKYQSAGRSLLEPLMQGYWEWLVRRVPAWIAPNLITIVGLIINICTTVILVYYCPTATEQMKSSSEILGKRENCQNSIARDPSSSSKAFGSTYLYAAMRSCTLEALTL